ncbi:MAG: hypothetical protein J5761_01965 [Paludibacteraceae bacterium]|nr:hypothetical protein [Paludibacteraceae bacterium]
MKKIFLFLLLLPAVVMQAADYKTVSEIMSIYNGLNLASGSQSDDTYTVRGYVTKWKSGYPSYQNADFFIDDSSTGSISLLECFRLTGQTDADKRELTVGDYVEVTGYLKNYNGNAEVVSGSFTVVSGEVWTPVPISISEFISKNDGKRYILTGVVTSFVNEQYCNLNIEDETGSIYVYGLKDANGASTTFSALGLEVNDTLTLTAVYQYYNNTTHEATSARYVSHVKPSTTPGPIDPTKTEVDFDTDFAGGWTPWIGKTLTFTNDFYLCNTSTNVVASHRLRSPEEYGDAGTSAYTAAVAANTKDSCVLSGVYFQSGCRPGAIIRGLQATVTSANNLEATNSPTIIYNELPTQRPDLGNANVVICGANLENFFVTLGGYAGAKNETQLARQKTKISSGLYHIDADIYALCEVEQGDRASSELVSLLNNLAGVDQYDWVNAGFDYDDAIMVCYIYRKDKIEPVGSYITPYSYTTSPYHYREAIQCFKHKATGEKFNISLNHFKAKDSSSDTGDGTRQTNMNMVTYQLSTAAANDPDILVMGDLNAYTMEESNLILSRDKGYTDLLMQYDPEGYSYVYDNLVGYLDHAYANSSMAAQVTKAVPYHLNADTDEWDYCYKSSNTSMYRYADHDPILVGLKLGNDTTALDEVDTKDSAVKVLRDGQLIIIRGGAQYSVTGVRLQ